MAMERMRRFVAAIALGLASGTADGCGGVGGSPRFDASTEEAAHASIEAMKAGLGDDARKRLADDLATFTPTRPDAALTGARKKARAKSAAVDKPNVIFKPLDGLTAAEIHDKAEQTRMVRKSRSPN